jgi:sterol desaturase/sphingolipid hydroxylase (fatty acid hydroxylase superfamily)
MTYDWKAALVYLGVLIALTIIGKKIAFMIPALERMRQLNEEADAEKRTRKRFREAVRVNNRSAMLTNAAIFLFVLPFCLNLEARPIWRYVVDIVTVLMVYDFFYYLTHRFVFHGKILNKVHALHHQARTPTYVDALYVHPLETAIGLVLFLGTIPLIAFLMGGSLNAVSMAIATLIFTQINTINHTFVDLPYFPFKTVDYITSIHAAHHVDMNQGNYATLTMFYDWLFGTLETPVRRTTA